jgi:hypothetical protein
MEKKYHAVIDGKVVEGKEFDELAENKYGKNWKQALDNMPTGKRGDVDAKMVSGVESGIYEGPSGF